MCQSSLQVEKLGKKPASKSRGKKPASKSRGKKPASKSRAKKPAGKNRAKKPAPKKTQANKPRAARAATSKSTDATRGSRRGNGEKTVSK
ncbi:hypothetical protein AeMF1_018117 [Aphanomyces euteiches]|nr:hypothetical protein AeMF1_018117 [Aphanomyces euteiches]